MQKSSARVSRKVKAAVLTMATVGMVYSSPCTVGDIWHNVVSGSLSFVEGYTGDIWDAVIPGADELLGNE